MSRNKREGYYAGCAVGLHVRQKNFHDPHWKKHRNADWAYDYRCYKEERRKSESC